MFFRYSIFYDILLLHIFASIYMLYFLVLCDGPYYRKEIKWLSTERAGGVKKKPTYFVIDERLIMRVYLYLEKWDYIDEMQRNRMISTETGIMLIGEKDGKTALYERTRWKSRCFSFKSRSMSGDLANVRYICTISIVFY